jgi:hypothetical protein
MDALDEMELRLGLGALDEMELRLGLSEGGGREEEFKAVGTGVKDLELKGEKL